MKAILLSENDIFIKFFKNISQKSNIRVVLAKKIGDIKSIICKETVLVFLDIGIEDISKDTNDLGELKTTLNIPLIVVDSNQLQFLQKSTCILFDNLMSSYVGLKETFVAHNHNQLIKLGSSLQFDIGRHCILKENKEFYLSPQESRILFLLCTDIGKTFTKQELIQFADLTNRSPLYVHINKLREKLEDTPSKPQLIITERGKGYRLSK
ncbi:winged helix-turn-helix domain-containing protein [Priestia megaterium]